jgi:hypothetical protein
MATPASIPEDAAVLRSASYVRKSNARYMKNILTLGAVLLLAAAASCSSSDSKPTHTEAGAGADSAAGGEAAGQASASAGDGAGAKTGGGAPASSGGASTNGGDAAEQGGAAGAAGAAGVFSIEGTVYAPGGGDVEATVVIGCAWIDGDCDEQKSQAIQVDKSGSSSPYLLENLEHGPTYLVLFWQDVNGSGEVDDGDYVGVVTDESGAARAFTSAATGADGIMAVKQAVAATAVPAELVGDWFTVATSIGATNEWKFAADGSASNGFTLNSSVCGGGAGTAINSQGVTSIDGDELTFQPTSGQKTVKPCSGPATTTDYYTNVRHFRWRVAPSSQQAGGTALYLTDLQNPDQTEAEFQKL